MTAAASFGSTKISVNVLMTPLSAAVTKPTFLRSLSVFFRHASFALALLDYGSLDLGYFAYMVYRFLS
jgi:hypothetical protein